MKDEACARILCALDTTELDRAVALAKALHGRVGGVKLGKEFFTAHGPQGVARIADCGLRIFLDLKFHDIPNTVAGAIRAASALGCFLLTVHAAGGPAMLRAASDAASEAGDDAPRILAVTVLTSLDDGDLKRIGQQGPVADQVLRLARLAESCGIDGAVCAPPEIAALRTALGEGFSLVVPGVRPGWAGADDQKRVMTPSQAVGAGADYLVVGRPITRDADPAGAAERIAAEIRAGGA